MSPILFVLTLYVVEVACNHYHSSSDFNRSLFLNEIEMYQSMLQESLYDTPTKDKVVYPREEDYGSMNFHNVTWLSSHNAHANNFAAGRNFVRRMATNQEYSIYKQLKDFYVRGLMLDIQYIDGGIRLVHGFVTYSWLKDIILYEIIPFLNEDLNAIITIDLETLGNRELLMHELRILLYQTSDFTRRIFNIYDERWDDYEWPTVQQLIDADQRVILISDNGIVQSKELGIMLRANIMMENHWDGVGECIPRNTNMKNTNIPWSWRVITGAGTRRWSRLFTMNHFCCSTGIESLKRVQPTNIGGGDNGWGILYPRSYACTAANGLSLKPNYIAIDWVHIGDAFEIVHHINFGGRVSTGQRCETGLDCATGSCSIRRKVCHCQRCDEDARPGCSGCAGGEECLEVGDGVNKCISNTSDTFYEARWNSACSGYSWRHGCLFTILLLLFMQIM